jgi:hypothetical protein
MSAVIVEFPVREKATAKIASRDSDFVSAQVIIFSGVRHERLDDIARGDESDTPSSPRRKKTS